MKVVLIGHGKMGKAVEEAILQRGHKISAICKDSKSLEAYNGDAEICIDFTSPQAFAENYKMIGEKFRIAIVGTSGWEKIQKDVFAYFAKLQRTLIYANNFSLGVNIFAHVVKIISEMLAGVGDYDPYMIEMHHSQKKDAPSGTAKMLDMEIKKAFGKSSNPVSIRCGHIKGVHEIGFESDVDNITLKHEAYSRQGFVEGAIFAAELSDTVSGIWDFHEFLEKKFMELTKPSKKEESKK